MVNIQYKNKLHLLAAVILLCSTARLHYLVLTCDTPVWIKAVCIAFGAYYGFVLRFFIDDIKRVLARRREKRSGYKDMPKNAVQNNKL